MTQEQGERLAKMMASEPQQAGSIQTQKPKPWAEASIEDKIERTRQQVKSLQSELRYAFQRISELQSGQRDLVDHRHDMQDGGKVMLPAGRDSLDIQAGCDIRKQEIDPSKLYF